MNRPDWDFLYAPPATSALGSYQPEADHVVATATDVDPTRLAELLTPMVTEIRPLLAAHPLYWTRVRTREPIERSTIQTALEGGGVSVRYICSSRRGSQELAPQLDWRNARPRLARDWPARVTGIAEEQVSPASWFLGPSGVSVDRALCGTGRGTRLAVIDNDAGNTEWLGLDAEILIGVEAPSRRSHHAGLLIGWAVGVGGKPSNGGPRRFDGVAPGASPRLYCIPLPGDVFSLPVAIARGVDDGADVVLCATPIDDQSSPLLDDALEFAARVGRGGLGACVVFPTGREVASAPGSMHASLTLSLGHPASDPRAFCIGPSSRDGGWFLWRDQKKRLRPFANRGPAVRCLAPGDDMANPFGDEGHIAHAESSGASAIAAGVVLLLIALCPEIGSDELQTVLVRTCTSVLPDVPESEQVADPFDFFPISRDPDGHNAKAGYGRLNAARACMSVRDPIAAALVAIGEDGAARSYLALRETDPRLRDAYSQPFGRLAARIFQEDASFAHSLSVLTRHARLVARRPADQRTHHVGAWVKQLAILLRQLERSPQVACGDRRVRDELTELAPALAERTMDIATVKKLEDQLYDLAELSWGDVCVPASGPDAHQDAELEGLRRTAS